MYQILRKKLLDNFCTSLQDRDTLQIRSHNRNAPHYATFIRNVPFENSSKLAPRPV